MVFEGESDVEMLFVYCNPEEETVIRFVRYEAETEVTSIDAILVSKEDLPHLIHALQNIDETLSH